MDMLLILYFAECIWMEKLVNFIAAIKNPTLSWGSQLDDNYNVVYGLAATGPRCETCACVMRIRNLLALMEFIWLIRHIFL